MQPTIKASDIFANFGNTQLDFAEFLNVYADDIGNLVNEYLPKSSRENVNKYLYSPLIEYSQNAGKRHRPLICFASVLALSGDVNKAMSSAAAIEHFHTAALIHDDIADEADIRRGKPALHIKEGIGEAINVGDLGLCLVNGTVMKDELLNDAEKVRIVCELIDMTRHTIEGQAMDIGWARDGRYDITEADYLDMATHKTAHYSGAVPLAIGAIVAGASEEKIECMRAFGLKTGLAFQLQDDILNLCNPNIKPTKDFRSDITEGKRTLCVVYALQNSEDTARTQLIEILEMHTKDEKLLEEAVRIMECCGAIDYAKSYARNLVDEANVLLKEGIPASPARDVLESMATWFVERLN